MNRDTYKVTVRREDPWWVAVVEHVGATETRTITALDDIVRDLIVVMRDVDDSAAFDLQWHYDLPVEAAAALADYQRARAEHEAAERRYEQNAERAAKALELINVSGRDAARLMHMSHQRVQQLRAGHRARRAAG